MHQDPHDGGTQPERERAPTSVSAETKTAVEVEKLRLEIKLLKRPLLLQPNILVSLLVALFSIGVGYLTGFFDIKRDRLAVERDRLALEKAQIQEGKDALSSRIVDLEARVQTLMTLHALWSSAEYLEIGTKPTGQRLTYLAALEALAVQSDPPSGISPRGWGLTALSELVRSSFLHWKLADSVDAKAALERQFKDRLRYFTLQDADNRNRHLVALVNANFCERMSEHYRDSANAEKQELSTRYRAEAKEAYARIPTEIGAAEQVLLALNNLAYMLYLDYRRGHGSVDDLMSAWGLASRAEGVLVEFPGVHRILGDHLIGVTLYDTAFQLAQALDEAQPQGHGPDGSPWGDLKAKYSKLRRD